MNKIFINAMTPNALREIVQNKLNEHFQEDPGIILGYYKFENETIYLIEVTNSIEDCHDDVVLSFRLRPYVDFPWHNSVCLLSKRDHQRIIDGELSLPEGMGNFSSYEIIEIHLQ